MRNVLVGAALSSILLSFQAVAENATEFDYAAIADVSYELKISEIYTPKDDVRLYRLPIISLGLYDGDDEVMVTPELDEAFSAMIGIRENDFAKTSYQDGFLRYSTIDLFFDNTNPELLTDLYQFMYDRTISCMKTLSLNDAIEFENYILDPQGLQGDIGIEEMVQSAKPIADEMYRSYRDSLCQNPITDFEPNALTELFLAEHIKALLEADRTSVFSWGSDLGSLSRVFDNLYLSENTSLYSKIMTFILLSRYRDANDSISEIDDVLAIKEIENTNYDNYMDFLLDTSKPINVRTSVTKACDNLGLCLPMTGQEFRAGFCVSDKQLYHIFGFGLDKLLMTIE